MAIWNIWVCWHFYMCVIVVSDSEKLERKVKKLEKKVQRKYHVKMIEELVGRDCKISVKKESILLEKRVECHVMDVMKSG